MKYQILFCRQSIKTVQDGRLLLYDRDSDIIGVVKICQFWGSHRFIQGVFQFDLERYKLHISTFKSHGDTAKRKLLAKAMATYVELCLIKTTWLGWESRLT